MTCECLYRDDAYLRSCAARVTAVSERGIELDRTVFTPRGGGQPGDTGGLRRADGVEVRLIDTYPGEEPGRVLYIPEPGAPALAVGDVVATELDGERHYAHLRLHTALRVSPPRGAGRVRRLRTPGINLQPCGGIHVRYRAEIGPVTVVRRHREGKRNQRVEIELA